MEDTVQDHGLERKVLGKEDVVQGHGLKRHSSDTVAITEDLIVSEILTRLTVRSLLRFKTVCRSWYAQINHPSFIAAHLEQSRKNPELAIISAEGGKCNQTITIYKYEGQKWHFASFLFERRCPTVQRVLNRPHHSNGLVFLSLRTELLVCNPSTREFTVLPKGSLSAHPSHNIRRRRAGFEFVPCNVYKVAQYFYRSYSHGERTCSLGFEVFTLGIDSSWRVTSEDPPYPIDIECSPISASGAIYFKIDNSLHKSSPKYILSFDLRDEKFTVIPPPPGFKGGPRNTYHMTELDNTLCFIFKPSVGETYDKWVYKDCTWIHSYTLQFPPQVLFFSFIAVRHGKLLLQVNDTEKKVSLFDPQSNSFETVTCLSKIAYFKGQYPPVFFNEKSAFQVISYVESLVPVRPKKIEL